MAVRGQSSGAAGLSAPSAVIAAAPVDVFSRFHAADAKMHGAEDALEVGQGASESSETSSEGGDVQQQDTQMAEAGDEVQMVEDSGDGEGAAPAKEAPVRWALQSRFLPVGLGPCSACAIARDADHACETVEDSGDDEGAEAEKPAEEAPVR